MPQGTTLFQHQLVLDADHITLSVNLSGQAMRMRSGVAGLSRPKCPVSPCCCRAARTASLMAKNTEAAQKSGGSPTALEE